MTKINGIEKIVIPLIKKLNRKMIKKYRETKGHHVGGGAFKHTTLERRKLIDFDDLFEEEGFCYPFMCGALYKNRVIILNNQMFDENFLGNEKGNRVYKTGVRRIENFIVFPYDDKTSFACNLPF